MDRRRLLSALGPVVAAAGIGGLGARTAPRTYARLRKPGWAPPAGAFGPVWSALYVGIGVAGWRLTGRATPRVHALHLGQLALNGAWPVTFFGVRRKGPSLVVIAALDVVVAAEIAELRRTDPVAAALLVPYLAWTLFATALNAAVSDPAA